MKLFIDTADLTEVTEIAQWGILDGVTTNPSLVKKAGGNFKQTVTTMCKLVDEVSAQVTAENAEEMIKQADEYSSWHENIVVKVPMTVEGLKTITYCTSKGIKTNTTLVFSVNQAVLAAKAGATMISPFVGRIDDTGHDGMDLIAEIMQVWNQQGYDTQVLVASTRHPRHIADAAQLGAHICTIPYSLFTKLPLHPLTDAGYKKFKDDWASIQNT